MKNTGVSDFVTNFIILVKSIWIILMKIVRILFRYISCPYLLTAVMLLYFMTIA